MFITINAMSSNTLDPAEPADGSGFRTTHWSLVLLAGSSTDSKGENALEGLCRVYWQPLYAYVRRQGYGSHDAQDLTQDFFARLLQKDYLRLADPGRGRFRSFLLKSLKHFLVNEWVRGQAQKRGAGKRAFSLDEEAAERTYLQQPADQLAPEHFYDRHWAMTLLERAMDQLGADYAAASKEELFRQLKPLLLTEVTATSYQQLAGSLGLTEGAVKVALHRLRQRFRDAVRAEVAHTVATPEEVDEELRCLMAALNK
jgi:RNA polymerase sigma factor (sigma-70 family)